MKNFNLPALWGGAGLRHEHFNAILEERPPFRWFEIITEDFMDFGGYSRDCLMQIREHYQIVSHCVCLAVGSTDPLDLAYLKRLRVFLDEIKSPWTSDHLCFTKVDHTNLLDLIPVPFTDESVKNIVSRVKVAQDILERPFLLENVTRYVTVSDREMGELEFLTRIATEADCGLLLDVTNVYLNSQFHAFDPLEFIRALPLDRVGQIHLAGWEGGAEGANIDTHDAPVPPVVWNLFRETLKLTGETSVLVEWDDQLPTVDVLLAETQTVDSILSEVIGTREAA